MILSVLLGLWAQIVSGLEVIPLAKDQEIRYINDSVQVYYTLDTLSGAEAMSQIAAGKMARNMNTRKAPGNLGNNTFWILFRTKNTENKAGAYFINFTFNRTDLLTLYEIKESDSSVVELYQTGDLFDFNKRPVHYRSFMFPVDFAPGEEKIFLLNADKRGTVDRFPIRVLPAEGYDELKTGESIRYGLFFGFFICISIVSIIVGIAMKRSVFIFYGLYALLIGMYLFTSVGMMFQYITPGWPEFNYYNIVVFGSWAIVFFSFYSRHFFQYYGALRLLDPIQNGVAYGLIAIVNIPFLLSVFVSGALRSWILDHYMIVLLGNYSCVLLIFIFSFIRAFYFIKKSSWLGALFLFGIFWSFAGITYSVLVDNGVFPDFIFVDNSNAVLAGFMIEIIFLTTAMVIYIRKNPIREVNLMDELKVREMHHRVKNNLQVISSLMNLQAMQLGDQNVQKIISDGQKRINAMSLVHQKLYQQNDVESLDVKDYLETLIQEISELYNQENKVQVKLDIQRQALDIECITSIGMIVNELVVNSFKYAFDGVAQPEIVVAFEKQGQSYKLAVQDNGVGVPGGMTLEDTTSFGLKLVKLLVRQLKASVTMQTANGMNYQMTFTR